MQERNKDRLYKLFGVFLILIIIFNFIPTSYNLMEPGIVKDLSEVITVEDGYHEAEGSFYLTSVSSPRASVIDYFYVKLFNPDNKRLIPREQQIPAGMDIVEYLEVMSELMEESKLTAQALAFEKAGLDYSYRGDGAEVVEVMEEGTAIDYLESGDVIIEVNDHPVELVDEATQLIQQEDIGTEIKLKVLRDGEEINFKLPTLEMEGNPGVSSIGVLITNKNISYDFAKNIYFETEQIVGPSAGSMFVLEIYNQLTEEDITKGKKIAGTGSVSLDGRINKIDGTLQKVIASRESKADIFLVPQENYEEIKDINDSIEIIAVEKIDDSFDYLSEISKEISI